MQGLTGDVGRLVAGQKDARAGDVRGFPQPASGDAGGFGAEPDAMLIDLVHSLKAGHRQGASFVMNSATLASKKRTATRSTAPVWRPPLPAWNAA